MCHRIKFCMLMAGLFFVFSVPSVSAQSAPANDREKTMDERLNCFSRHASQEAIDWDEVCSVGSDSQNQDARAAKVSDSLDEMVARLQAAGDEMLNETNGDEIPAADIDDVYRKHEAVFDTDRTVDDVVRDEGIENDFTTSTESQDPMDEETNYDAPETDEYSVQDQNNEYARSARNSYKERNLDLFDEPELMADTAKDTSVVRFRTHTFDIGYEKYYYEYEEDSVNVLLEGWWDTFSAAYTYRPQEGDLLNLPWMNHYRLEGRYGFADLDYSSGSTGTSDDDPNHMFETRALIGRDFYPLDRVVITPYGGFGYRHLVDDSGGKQTTTGHWGYDRKSHYYYLPLGFDYHYQVNRDWRISGNGELDIFLYGWQKSYLSDVPFPGYFDLRNDQKHGFGVRGSIKLIKTTPLIDFSVEPFVRFWHIEDSEVDNAGLFDGYEPENTTLESGVRAGVQF